MNGRFDHHHPGRGVRALVLGLAALGLTACGETAPPSRTDPDVLEARRNALERKAPETPDREPGPAVVGEVPARLMEELRAHLARRTGAQPDAFDVVRAESRVWPSGALGCPQPDMTYTPQPVPGYWVVLRHEGREYDYRLSEAGMLVLCEGMALENPPAL